MIEPPRQPSSKHPDLARFLDQLFGRERAIREGYCTGCERPVTGFRDALSAREFTISGLCQACQDDIFNHVP